MKFPLKNAVTVALSLLFEAGYEAYLVGGCVRDFLRGEEPHDFDMTTNALPSDLQRVFSGFRTIETGLRHGTLTILIEGMPIEITTYRVDGDYADHRHPSHVVFTPSLKEDLARRDFTVNAMAYHPDTGIVDCFGGQEDLANGVIRAVGVAEKRFSEDALRILRALRFAARFGFTLEKETAIAARAKKDTLKAIAAERVREELFSLVTAQGAKEVLAAYSDIIAVVFSEACLQKTFFNLENDRILRLADLLRAAGDVAARAALLRLRTDNETISSVLSLLPLLRDGLPCERAVLARTLRAVGEKTLLRAIAWHRANGEEVASVTSLFAEMKRENFPYLLSHLALNGEDVKAATGGSGKQIGEALEAAYTAVIEGRVRNTSEALFAFLKETHHKG